jgi:hypothetical protein
MSPNNNKNTDDRPHGNHNNAKRTLFSSRLDRTTSYYDEDEFEAIGAAAGERTTNKELFGTPINSSCSPINTIITTRTSSAHQHHYSSSASYTSPRLSISSHTSIMIPLFSDNLVSNSKEIQTNIFMTSSQMNINDDDDVAFDRCVADDDNANAYNVRSESKMMLPYMPMFDDGEESFCSDECDGNENENQNKFTGGNNTNEGGIRASLHLSPAPPGVVVVLDGSPLFPHQDADTNEESNYKMSINTGNNNSTSNDNNKSSNNFRSRLTIHRTLSFDDVNFDGVNFDDTDDEDNIQHQQECDLSFTIPITGTSSGGRNRSNFLYHVS